MEYLFMPIVPVPQEHQREPMEWMTDVHRIEIGSCTHVGTDLLPRVPVKAVILRWEGGSGETDFPWGTF